MLDVQIQVLSLDTGNFYYDDEAELHERNRVVRTERRKLINGYNERLEDKSVVHHKGTKELLVELDKAGLSERQVNSLYSRYVKEDYSFESEDYKENVRDLLLAYFEIMNQIAIYRAEAKRTKQELLDLLKSRVEYNIGHKDKHVRELRENTITDSEGNIRTKNIISVFDSSFTRIIGAKPDKLSKDFMVVQIYYFDVMKDLILHGFTYNGIKYKYFTSSAGQIRTKKCVFIKESVWQEHEREFMCGLTIELINVKGGINPTKFLSYLALINSATDVWQEFDIDKAIIVDDFETQVWGEIDFVDDKDFSITRKFDYVPITHTDGCGMILPEAFGKKQKNMMVRLPWIKGLLGVFNFKRFIEVNQCSHIIRDIYGQKHDVIAEDIQVIFTKSQFKLANFYNDWEQYKENYKRYGCTAGYANVEEDRIKNATINYQMLQSLTDITEDEIKTIASSSIHRLDNICSSVECVRDIFGATVYNTNKTAFQEAICIYPELLNDIYVKNKIREIKNRLVKQYKAGKLQIDGKYTFILPDLYAACQHWFQGLETPTGLLGDGEVFCWLFRKSDKLDCLRSPHLYREHAVRKNIACYKYGDRQQQIRQWFTTNAIYTSSFDLLSKVLMFDVDGDSSLVVSDKTLIEVAERNIKGVVPLYYVMRKAQPCILTNEVLYNSLIVAFKGGNIGEYSNNISKIWNSDVFISGTREEQQRTLDYIKLLCTQNNYVIDYAKTLYKPEFSSKIKAEISEFTKSKLPHFFVYAKDKNVNQVESANRSFVNKLETLIPNPRVNSKYLGKKSSKLHKPDYRLLMSDMDFELTDSTDSYEAVIAKYLELNRQYRFQIDCAVLENLPRRVLSNSQIRQKLVFSQIVSKVKTVLSEYGFSEFELVDILIKYLYDIKNSENKTLLWVCFGDVILENLIDHKGMSEYKDLFAKPVKEIQCQECGEWIQVDIYVSSNRCRCPKCSQERTRELTKNRVRRFRERQNN